ncbi:MAG: DsrE family protein [Gemmatimonadetes bacterium]|nr:DsrE family protein [Gemmatimonadota bacterium]
MRALVILNDAPYGSERVYNALRLAGSLTRIEGVALKLFLIGDAVACAKSGQRVPSGYYNVQTMLRTIAVRGASIGVCGSCMDARGIADSELLVGAHRSAMEELIAWTLDAEKIIAI